MKRRRDVQIEQTKAAIENLRAAISVVEADPDPIASKTALDEYRASLSAHQRTLARLNGGAS